MSDPDSGAFEGEVIADKYRLTTLIGQGGMGAVWAGIHTSLGTRVAVKFINAEHTASDVVRKRFINEARAAAALRSKHVVQVYDHGVTDDGRPYIVMEYLAGESLDKRMARLGRLPPKETATIIAQVAKALMKAHEVGIIHRDLKPENVFLVWDDDDGKDVVKVVDFGIAKFTEGLTNTTASSTRTGAVLGTPHFMSPEQARGLRSIDHRADLWSLGVIAYEAMVGQLPFNGEALGDLLVNICTGVPPKPSSVLADVPQGFDGWVQQALARDPEGRFATAADMANALLVVCGMSPSLAGDGSVVGSLPQRMPSTEDLPAADATRAPHGTHVALTRTDNTGKAAGRGRLVALVAALVAVGAGAAGYVFFARDRAASPAVAEAASTTVASPGTAPAPSGVHGLAQPQPGGAERPAAPGVAASATQADAGVAAAPSPAAAAPTAQARPAWRRPAKHGTTGSSSSRKTKGSEDRLGY